MAIISRRFPPSALDPALFVRRDGSTTLTADWSVGSFSIKDLVDPVDPQDAATKAYVDSLVGTPYFAGIGLTLSGGDTFDVDYGTSSGTALEGSRDGLYVHIAGVETITGAKTFNLPIVLGPLSGIQADTGSGIISAYAYSSGHEFGGGSVPMMIVGTTSSEMKTNGSVRYVQVVGSHSFYTSSALKMTLTNGVHVGALTPTRLNGELGVQSGFVQGTGVKDASASIDLQSTTTGVLVNRLTTTQRNAVSSPATSLLIFNTTKARFEYYTGSAWKPITEGGMSIYVAGAAGTGPGGTDPQYATIAAMQAAMVADGANAGSPRVGFFTGTFVEDVTMVDGCWLVGLYAGAQAQVISGSVTTLTTSTIAGLSNCTVAPPGASNGGFNNQSVDGFFLRFENVAFFGDGVAGNAGFWADGSLLSNDSLIYAVNCSVNGSGDNDGFKASGPIEILWNGTIRAGAGSAGSTQRAIRLDDAVDMIVTVPAEVNAESGLPKHVYGSVTLENASVLTLGTGVNVFGFSNYTVGPVFVETSLFQLEDGSYLTLQGGHTFQMDTESDYLFNTGTTGNVATLGNYTLDTLNATRYQTAAGITYDGYPITRTERVQTITGTATIADATTLALVIPASGTTFTVTMSNPAGWRTERRLRIKYTGGVNTQDLTLAAHASAGIDYDTSYNSTVFKWNDSFDFAAHDSKWIILSAKRAALTPTTYTLPVFLIGPAGSGPGGSSPPYATLAAAKAAMTAGANQLAILMPGTYTEDLTIDTLAMSVAAWVDHPSVGSTGIVKLVGTITVDPNAANRDIAINNIQVAPSAGNRSIVVTGANAVYVSLSGTRGTSDQETLYVDNTSASTKVVGENCSFVSTGKEAMKFVGAAHNHDFKATGASAAGTASAVRTGDGAKVTFHDGGSIVNPVYALGAGSAITLRTGITHSTGANNPYKVSDGGAISTEGVRLASSATKLVEDVLSTGGFFFPGDLKVSGGVPLSYDSGVVVAPVPFVPGAVYEVITATGAISEYADFVFLGSSTKIVASLPNGTNRIPKPVTVYALDAPIVGTAHEVDVTGGGTVGGAATKAVPAGKAFGSIPAILTNDWFVVWDTNISGGSSKTFVPLLHGVKITTASDTSEAVIGGGAWIAADHTGGTAKLRATGASTDGASDVELRLYRLVAGVWTLVTGLNGADDWLTITDANGEHVESDDVYSQLADGDVLQLRVTPTNVATQAVIYRGELAVTP